MPNSTFHYVSIHIRSRSFIVLLVTSILSVHITISILVLCLAHHNVLLLHYFAFCSKTYTTLTVYCRNNNVAYFHASSAIPNIYYRKSRLRTARPNEQTPLSRHFLSAHKGIWSSVLFIFYIIISFRNQCVINVLLLLTRCFKYQRY